MTKFRVEIIIRGIDKMTEIEQEDISRWIQQRGKLFSEENRKDLANRFTYRLVTKK